MRYLIRFSYDGSKFYGFQRLKNKPTVQQSIEDALSHINKNPVVIKGAGRTDIGVHAYHQCAHFDINVPIPVDGLKSVLDKLVGPYIHILECQQVDKDFHARFCVKEKTYQYRIYFGEYNPLLYDYAYICDKKLDIEVMKKTSMLFLGGHCFKNFVSGERENYDAIIYKIDFERKDDYLFITFIGKSFYRYMVRNLVGALLDFGCGKSTYEDIKEALEHPEIKKTFPTASSKGLYLIDIQY